MFACIVLEITLSAGEPVNKTALTKFLRAGLILLAAVHTASFASAQQSNADVLKTIDQLIEQNRQLEKQNQQLMEQVNALRQSLTAQPAAQPAPATPPAQAAPPARPPEQALAPVSPPADPNPDEAGFGEYTPNQGFKVADTRYGDLSISLYSYARYLNQRGLNPTYTDAFGNTKNVQQRQDLQLTKVQFKFLGWIMTPKLRYFLYAWTSNASQGQPAQVVLAGNVGYTFNKHFTLSAGINALPGTRSTEGNFPYWLSVDSRMITDEFFRGSYTSGVFARGQITNNLRYQVMLGNNLSTLGVSAAQLDKHFNTFASALVWDNKNYGIGFGDFEHHEKAAFRVAGHFSNSTEDRQSQPNSESIENTQLRLSDGSIIFTPELFGKGISITQANYKMTSFDTGIKYHGLSVEGGYYARWLGKFKGSNTGALPSFFDHGGELQTSLMVIPKTLQLYGGASIIFGQYGTPWDSRGGLNWFPWKNKVVRWNNEGLYLHKSPVGYTSVPFAVGGKGFVFHSTFELAF
jgi:hypothetical protein